MVVTQTYTIKEFTIEAYSLEFPCSNKHNVKVTILFYCAVVYGYQKYVNHNEKFYREIRLYEHKGVKSKLIL